MPGDGRTFPQFRCTPRESSPQCNVADAEGSGSFLVQGKAKQIFLSYSSRDRDGVKELARLLRAEGFSVWQDVNEIVSGHFRDDLGNGVEMSKVYLLVMTPNSLGSDEVKREANSAEITGKVLLPVYLDAAYEDLKHHLKGTFLNLFAGLQGYRFDRTATALPAGLFNALVAACGKPEGPRNYDGLKEEIRRDCERLTRMIDRVPQATAVHTMLRGAFSSRAKGQPLRPRVLVLHGPDHEHVGLFTKSLLEDRMPRFLDGARALPQPPVFILEPPRIERFDPGAVLNELAAKLSLPYTCEGADDILHELEAMAGDLAPIQFRVHTARHSAKSLRRFLEAFAKFWGDFPASARCQVLPVLEWIYSGEKPGEDRATGDWLKKLSAAGSKSDQAVVVLPMMEQIEPSVAKGWLILPEVDGFLTRHGISHYDADKLIDAVYLQHKKAKALPMKTLAPALYDALIHHLSTRS